MGSTLRLPCRSGLLPKITTAGDHILATHIVNFFAGPGAGKSTTATGLFSRLKALGINAEYVPEFAKDLTWEDRTRALACWPYVFGEQLFRIERLVGKVEVIVTDSPVLLAATYAPDWPVEISGITDFYSSAALTVAMAHHRQHESTNFFIKRTKPYHTAGRGQTEEEAWQLDYKVSEYLRDIPIHTLQGTEDQMIEEAAWVLWRRIRPEGSFKFRSLLHPPFHQVTE